MDIIVWQAALDDIPDGNYMIGQVGVRDSNTKDAPTFSVILLKPWIEEDDKGPIWKPPRDYELTWDGKGSGGSYYGLFWRVNAPYGYMAFGDIVTSNYHKPTASFSAKDAYIIHDLLAEESLNPEPLWTDRDSGAKKDGSVWQVGGNGLGGIFKVQSGYEKSDLQVSVLPSKVAG